MSSGILSVGASGLSAAYAGLQTTGHNIANVSTPGYKRQQIVQTSSVPQFSGGGYLGNGVSVSTITRAFSDLATQEVNRAEARVGEADAGAAYLKRLDSLLGDSANDIGVAINTFFNSLQALSTAPSSSGQRAAFLSDAKNLATRFSETSDAISVLKDTAARDLSLSLANVNDLGKQVAALNARISLGLASGQTPNDLMDQRDNLINKIASEIAVTTTTQTDGSVNVLIGNGQPLVVGDRVSTLALKADANDPSKLSLVLQGQSGSVQLGSDGTTVSGKIGALMNTHNRDLNAAENELGRLAIAIAYPLNLQHQAGLDLQGSNGGNLFTLPAASTYAFSTNTGTAAVDVSIADASKLKASDYRLDFDGTNYQLTRLSDGVQQGFTTLPATADGFNINLASGAMAAGDSFSLKPVSTRANGIAAALQDPARLALAIPVSADAALTNAGNVTIQNVKLSGSANTNLTQPVTLTFTGTNSFNVSGTGTGNPVGQTYAAGSPITFNGWTLNLSGTPRIGDTITIGPNTNLQGDNRNALNLTSFASSKIVDGQTPAQSFAATLATIGSLARSANLNASVQGAVRDDAVANEQSVSGVNLDEEAARLLQYQQAYQAAARVISTAQTIFDTLLNLGR